MTADSKPPGQSRSPLLQSPEIRLFVVLTIIVLGNFTAFVALPKDGTVAFSPVPGEVAYSCPKQGCDTSSWWFVAYFGLFTFPGNALSAQIHWKASANVVFFVILPIPCGRAFCTTGYLKPPSSIESPAVICLSLGNEDTCQFSTTMPADQTWMFEALSPVSLDSGFNFSFEGFYSIPGPNLPW
ncbi:MAG: hypothetical protein L3K14_00540 [Thermoplasmata archaeon]|nr:hypothetical protein [Thermoplasmata archaeon]